MNPDAPLLIVGTGHAGYTLAREFRKLSPDAPLKLLTADDGTAYYKPNLSKALATGKTADDLAQAGATAQAETLGADVATGHAVERIDPAEGTVTVGGTTQAYRSLVLAVGARPIRPPVDGDADALLSINSLDDYRHFRGALRDGAHVLLVGAGLIGCEFANDLAATGYRVTAVDLADWPLPTLLPEAAGRALRAGLAGLGVDWRFGDRLQQIEQSGDGVRATLASGETLDADLAVSAVGLRPDTALAESAGLACERGILVDEYLRCSAPGIHALGDCAQIHGQVLPFILPIAHGARALAATLAGTPTPAAFPVMPVLVKTPACPVVVCPPPAGLDGEWQVEGEAPDLAAVFRDGSGAARGFALTGAATRRRGEFAGQVPPLYAPGD